MSGSEDEETSSPSDDVEAGEQTRNSGSRSPEAPTRTSTTNTLNADLMNANLNDPSLPSPNKAVRSAQVGVSRGKGKDQSDSSDTVDYGAKLDGQPPRKRASLNDKTPVKALQETDSIQASPTPLPHILSAPTAPYFTDSPAPSRSATMQDSRPVQLPPVKNLLNMVDARKDQDIPRSHAMTIPIPPADAITTGPPLSATFSSSSATPSSYGHQRERSRTGSLSSAAALYPPGSAAGQKRPFSHQSGSIGLPLSNAISPPTMTPTLLPESSTQGSPASDENARSMTGDDIHRQGHASYKCDFPGCTASPFITQYLLKYVSCLSSTLHTIADAELATALIETCTRMNAHTTVVSRAVHDREEEKDSSGATRCFAMASSMTLQASSARFVEMDASTDTQDQTTSCATSVCTIKKRISRMSASARFLCSADLALQGAGGADVVAIPQMDHRALLARVAAAEAGGHQLRVAGVATQTMMAMSKINDFNTCQRRYQKS